MIEDVTGAIPDHFSTVVNSLSQTPLYPFNPKPDRFTEPSYYK